MTLWNRRIMKFRIRSISWKKRCSDMASQFLAIGTRAVLSLFFRNQLIVIRCTRYFLSWASSPSQMNLDSWFSQARLREGPKSFLGNFLEFLNKKFKKWKDPEPSWCNISKRKLSASANKRAHVLCAQTAATWNTKAQALYPNFASNPALSSSSCTL